MDGIGVGIKYYWSGVKGLYWLRGQSLDVTCRSSIVAPERPRYFLVVRVSI